MPDTFHPYSNSINLSVIRAISLAVVHDVAPDEELSAKKLTSPIAQAYEEGQIIVAGAKSTTSGGFGDVDIVTLVIVPVVIAVLAKLSEQLAVSANDLKGRLQDEEKDDGKATKRIYELVERQYTLVSVQVKSKKAHPKEKIIKEAIKQHIKKVFELEP